MKIFAISDIHLDHGPHYHHRKPDADLIIVAGDLGQGTEAIPWLLEWSAPTPVVYVLGNHEYYHETYPDLQEGVRTLTAGTHIHFLENESLEIGGVSIFGCTLWTDFECHGSWALAAHAAQKCMNDYWAIRRSTAPERPLWPHDTRVAHLNSRTALEHFLRSKPQDRSIVVTHHAPSPRSLGPRQWESGMGSAYASRLDALIETHGPSLWVHGHTHHCVDYRIGQTRVVSNPHGYPSEPAEGFDSQLAVDL